MGQIIDQIINIATELFDKISAILGDYLLFAAGLGLSILLLLVLLISSRRRNRLSNEDGDVDFLEVGPEPVIVYRRSDSVNTQVPSSPPLEQTISPPPKVETIEHPLKKEVTVVQEQLAVAQDIPAAISGIQPVMDPEPMPDAEPDFPRKEQPPKQMQKLPYLQSELAHSTLKLFTEQGFEIEKIVYQGIYGADFIAARPGIRVYIQIKDRKKPLSDIAVTEVSSYAINHHCNTSIIVSPGSFNRAAVKAASRLNVSLWNNKNFAKLQDDPIFR